MRELLLQQVETSDLFNEKVLKIMCINKAISKLDREMKMLVETRDHIISNLEDHVESDKLDNLIFQMKTQHINNGSIVNQNYIGVQNVMSSKENT